VAVAAPRENKDARIFMMGVEDWGVPRMLGGQGIESQTAEYCRPDMDRNAAFATQLAHLVAIYAQSEGDRTAEKAVLRAARAAVKHGDISLSMLEGTLRAGHLDMPTSHADVAALHVLFGQVGLVRIEVVHQARQEEIKAVAHALADARRSAYDVNAFAAALARHTWKEVGVELAVPAAANDAATSDETAVAPAAPPPTEVVQEADVAALDAVDVAPPLAMHEATSVAPPSVVAEDPAELEPLASSDSFTDEAPAATGPLAERLPDAVAELAGERHRELFERLITSSEPGTLRRLLEPVQAVVEQMIREGQTDVAVRLIQAMMGCEECAVDPEMRRQFVVVFRRLTKPTMLRAIAMLYGDAQVQSAGVEQVLARFDEDGAEAVADCAATAPTSALAARYTALLARLPGTVDALLAMLDDARPGVVVRALGLMVQLKHPATERVLGEQLGHQSARVRQAAALGLAAIAASTFTADALLRAMDDEAPEVRLAAAVGLQSRRDARLVAVIVTRLDQEPEVEIQLALITALGRMAAPEGVAKLITLANPDQRQMRRREAPLLRISAIEAMGEARTPAAMVALQKLLEDREKDVRETAARLYTRARRQTVTAGIAVGSDS
jgi:HEAT repeat protein